MTDNASPSSSQAVPPWSTFRHTCYGHRKNAPEYSFSKDALKQRADVTALSTVGPGPGAYEWGDGVPHTSACITASAFTEWGADATKRSRLGLPSRPHTLPPGPGLYLRSKSQFHLLGSEQQVSQWRNSTTAGWSKYCRRECRTPLVMSREHERERLGSHSPGPMTGVPVDSVGRQLLSQKPTQPRCSFSRASRFSDANLRWAAAVPGPGAFDF